MAAGAVPDDCPLTRGQHEVLALVTDGMTYQQAALELGLAESTVRSHASSAYARLGVSNAAGAAVQFMRRGWHRQASAPEPPEEPVPERPAGRKPFPLPPFAAPYLEALDRHLADGDDQAAQRDLSVAAIGLTGRKPPQRDRDVFLDRVLAGLGVR